MSPEKFSELWISTFSHLRSFVHRCVDQVVDEEDILQDVAVIAWNKKDTLRSEDKFTPWIFTITRNCLKKYYKTKNIEVSTEIQQIDELLMQYDLVNIDKIAKNVFLDNLEPVWRKIVILNIEYGFSAKEITRLLGNTMNAGTIKNRTTRITKLLAHDIYEGGS